MATLLLTENRYIVEAMGLDILIRTHKEDNFSSEVFNSISRTFVPLILRPHPNNDDEIFQISNLTGMDLTPLLEMGEYPDPEEEEYRISCCSTAKEKAEVKTQFQSEKQRCLKEIDAVIDRLTKLDMALKSDFGYYKKLKLTNPTQNYIRYFRNYAITLP